MYYFVYPSKIEHSGAENDRCNKEMILLLDKYANKERKKMIPGGTI